jgi:superfamily II DNA or RNA helicase
MQQLHTCPPRASFRCRSRTWRLVAHHAHHASVLVDLHGAAVEHAGVRLRLLCPPDVIVRQRVHRRVVSHRRWLALGLASVSDTHRDESPSMAAGAEIDPLAYQWVPAMALLSGRVERVLLADAVGLGKTIQAAIAIAEFHARDMTARTLVVVPASLLPQWADELRRRFSLDPAILDGDDLRVRSGRQAGHEPPVLPGEVCLLSIDTLKLPEVTAWAGRVPWRLLVVDEAHLLAPGTARRAAIVALLPSASHLLLLTATPFDSGSADPMHLLRIGHRDAQSSGRMLVIARGSAAGQRAAVRQRIVAVRPSEAERRVHALIEAYVTRALVDSREGSAGRLAAYTLARRACSCPEAAARSVERRAALIGQPASPTPIQEGLPLDDERDDESSAWLHVPAWSDLDAERAFLADVRRALQLVRRGTKLQWLQRWLRRCAEPAIIFTAYADTLRVLHRLLRGERDVACLFGAQTPGQRQLALERFCQGTANLLLATDAAAEGLNLHRRCRLVLHLDVPWSPARLAQRNGRVDRIGQARQVRALILAGSTSYDDQVLAALASKQARIDACDVRAHADAACAASRRREVVAQEALRRWTGTRGRSGTGPGSGDRLHAYVRPMRWRRLRDRLGLGAHARALVLVEATMSGVHPLVNTRRWFAYVSSLAAGHVVPDAALPEVLPHVRYLLTRGVRRSRRFADRDAGADEAARPQASRDLFRHVQTPSRGSVATDLDQAAINVLSIRVLACRR